MAAREIPAGQHNGAAGITGPPAAEQQGNRGGGGQTRPTASFLKTLLIG